MFNSFATSSSYLHFVWKRALRTLPALLGCLVVSGIVWGFHAGVIGSILVYLGGGIFFAGDGNGSLWSLFWEEIAYAAMAVLLSAGAYNKRWAIWILFFVGCAVAAAWDQKEPLWRITNLIPALFTGNLVYIYRSQISRIPWQAVLAAIVCVTAINQVFHFQPQAWYMVPIGCFLALTLCLNAPQMPKLPADISYGLYIFHDPIFYATSKLWPQSFSSLFVPGAVALVAVSVASWYTIEKPALSLKRFYPVRVRQMR